MKLSYLLLGHTVDEEGDPRGDIHTYRMALWSAHFGAFDEDFEPQEQKGCLLGSVALLSHNTLK